MAGDVERLDLGSRAVDVRPGYSAAFPPAATVSGSAPTSRSNGPITVHSAFSRSPRQRVDRVHPRLAHERRASVVARLGPVREQHAHRAALVPGAEVLRPARGAGSRAASVQMRPHEPRDRPRLALVEHA